MTVGGVTKLWSNADRRAVRAHSPRSARRCACADPPGLDRRVARAATAASAEDAIERPKRRRALRGSGRLARLSPRPAQGARRGDARDRLRSPDAPPPRLRPWRCSGQTRAANAGPNPQWSLNGMSLARSRTRLTFAASHTKRRLTARQMRRLRALRRRGPMRPDRMTTKSPRSVSRCRRTARAEAEIRSFCPGAPC